MRFRGLDLNLLSVFAVLMEERSVSRAADRLHLSQPTVSGALARLRAFFGDQLMIPEGRRMVPTPLAQSLQPYVADMLGTLGTVLDEASQFVPERSERTFRIAASDYVTMVVLRPLCRRLAAIAPRLRLMVEPPGERTTARLEEGQIDLLITPEDFASARHPVEILFEDRYVVVGDRANPALAGPISSADFFAMEHVTVLLGTDLPLAFADRQLDQLGLARRVALTVPNFSAVAWLVAGTPRIGLMHERLARLAADMLPIALSPLPFSFPPIREVLQRHRARGGDPGLRWLRAQLHEAAEHASGG